MRRRRLHVMSRKPPGIAVLNVRSFGMLIASGSSPPHLVVRPSAWVTVIASLVETSLVTLTAVGASGTPDPPLIVTVTVEVLTIDASLIVVSAPVTPGKMLVDG